MKNLLKLAMFLLLTGCASSPRAGNLVDVSVVDRTTGQQQPVYKHRGKLYVAGTPGNRYAVVMRNRTSGRLLTVISVDGINAINGKIASTSQSGYVLDPYDTTEITGWRKSMADVAAFYFTDLPDSYAARTDRPQNVGVIGVAVYRERPAPQPYWNAPSSIAPQEDGTADTSARSPEREAGIARKSERLGTGHGERETSPVTHTEFRRATSYPEEVVTIYYDSYRNLLARGVIPRKPKPFPEPVPFPAPAQFVPDPTPYRAPG